MPKKRGEKEEYRFYPDLDDQPRGDPDLSPWVPEGVFETGLAPVPEEYATFPWPKGFGPFITKRMGK